MTRCDMLGPRSALTFTDLQYFFKNPGGVSRRVTACHRIYGSRFWRVTACHGGVPPRSHLVEVPSLNVQRVTAW